MKQWRKLFITTNKRLLFPPPSYNEIIVNYNVQIQSKQVLHEDVSYSYSQNNTIPFQLVCNDFTT